MAFDAGMLACMVHEIRTAALGGRIERVMQPERDEIILQIRSFAGGRRLLINAGANPRIGFTGCRGRTLSRHPCSVCCCAST